MGEFKGGDGQQDAAAGARVASETLTWIPRLSMSEFLSTCSRPLSPPAHTLTQEVEVRPDRWWWLLSAKQRQQGRSKRR